MPDLYKRERRRRSGGELIPPSRGGELHEEPQALRIRHRSRIRDLLRRLAAEDPPHGHLELLGVSNHFVEPPVNAILSAARTGEVGDGKIFALPVEKVYRIRTGEENQAAVTPVEELAPS